MAAYVISDIHGECGANYPGGRLAAVCLDTGEEFYSASNGMGTVTEAEEGNGIKQCIDY